MSKLEQIEKQISELEPAEFEALANWVAERMAERWDAQMERDAASGRLDGLAETALGEFRLGRTTRL